MKNKKYKNIIIAAVILVLALIGGIVVANINGKKDKEVIKDEDNKQLITDDSIEFEGKKYTKNKDVKTILFLGVDNSDETVVKDMRGSSGQADAIYILAVNDVQKTIQVLQLSRETMGNVNVYDENGKFLFNITEQICLQYAYGDGKFLSNKYMKEAVSKVMGGIDIDYCVSFNMGGISSLTDSVNGVDMNLKRDYVNINETYKKGANINLKGDAAESFLRYRDTKKSGSNMGRMDRQREFLNALKIKIQNEVSGDHDKLNKILDVAGPYMNSDLDADILYNMLSYKNSNETILMPGEVKTGKIHDEFYLDLKKTTDIIIKIFYKS